LGIVSQGVGFRDTPRIRKHAPYLFLAKTSTTGYDMYIIVPVNDGEKLNAGSFSADAVNQTKTLNLTVVADPNVHQEYAVLHQAFSADNSSFLEAVVNVDNPTAEDYSGKLLLADAHEGSITPEAGLAYGCPYAYLAKNTQGEFVPFALLPLKANQAATDPEPSGNINCEHQVNIATQSPPTQDRIEAKLKINMDVFSYPDANAMLGGGWLSIMTVTGSSVSGYRVKVKNRNANSM
jgi:hypothetical protein